MVNFKEKDILLQETLISTNQNIHSIDKYIFLWLFFKIVLLYSWLKNKIVFAIHGQFTK